MSWRERLYSRSGWTLLSLLALGLAFPGAAEEPVADEIFDETIGVEVINIDVVVTDKKGRAVAGLTSDDFELRVDGQIVPVANFYAVTADRGGTPDPAAGATAPAPEPYHLVVYLDSFYLTPPSRERVIRDLPAYFERQTASGASIMLINRLQTVSVLTPFTSDPDELAEALSRLAETPAAGAQQRTAHRSVLRNIQDIYQTCEDTPLLDPCEDCLHQMIESARLYGSSLNGERRAAMAALGDVANALSVLDGRKALLHVSDGIQQHSGIDLLFYVAEQLCPQERWELEQHMLRQDLHDLNRLVSQANASRVTLYTLEAAGLRSFSSVSAEHHDSFFVPSATTDKVRLANLQSTLFYLSDETGGKAILNANRAGAGLDGLTDEFRNYYSLGYEPLHQGEGESHRVSVKVDKRGYDVRFRRSVLHKHPDQQLADRALGAVLFGVAENPLAAEVWLGPQTEDAEGRLRVPLEVAVPLDKLALISGRGGRLGRLTVIVAAPDEKKKTVVRKQEILIRLPAEAEEPEEAYRFGVNVDLEPGEYELGVGIWDDLAAAGSFLGVRVEARAPSGTAAEPREAEAGSAGGDP